MINKELLNRKTGDPFVDTGGLVINYLLKSSNGDISKLIEKTTKIYVNAWNGKLNAFFLNSKITQNSFKPDRKISETLTYFRELINETLPNEEGYCRVLGIKSKLFSCGRENSILSGSGAFLNFHPSFQPGIYLSKEAIIRLFFVPFGTIQLSDKIAILQSNDESLNSFFVEDIILNNNRLLATGLSKTIGRSNARSPTSALFDFALKWIMHAEDEGKEENIEINLYHFTNFAASPEIVLYNFSSSVYSFYRKVQYRTLKTDWQNFSHSFFKNKASSYRADLNEFEVTYKKEVRLVNYQEYKNWNNKLYENLLAGKSILGAFKDWIGKKRRPLNFEIVKLYQKHIHNMNENTLKVIERIADYVLQNPNDIKQRVRSLQMPTKAHEFRRALVKLEAKNLSERNTNTLFSLQEYALELFPDGNFWKETQDLLLIAIYQQMHERKIWFNDAYYDAEEDGAEETNS